MQLVGGSLRAADQRALRVDIAGPCDIAVPAHRIGRLDHEIGPGERHRLRACGVHGEESHVPDARTGIGEDLSGTVIDCRKQPFERVVALVEMGLFR